MSSQAVNKVVAITLRLRQMERGQAIQELVATGIGDERAANEYIDICDAIVARERDKRFQEWLRVSKANQEALGQDGE